MASWAPIKKSGKDGQYDARWGPGAAYGRLPGSAGALPRAPVTRPGVPEVALLLTPKALVREGVERLLSGRLSSVPWYIIICAPPNAPASLIGPQG
jgi:hypothetical protein